MKTITIRQLESIQNYDWIWPDKEYDENIVHLCGYCIKTIVEEEGDVCPECQKSLNELDGR